MFEDFSKVDEEFGNDRFREQIEALQETFDIAREHNADMILGGDLFHRRGSVKVEVFNKVYETFHKNKDVNVYMLRGNHDANTNSLYTQSSIEPFQYLENVTVISEPTRIDKEGNNVSITFLPYGDEVEDMKDFLDTDSQSTSYETQILVAHIGVEGATQGKRSHRLSGAFGYGDLHPDTYQFILLGHYHKRQMLGGNPNHLYGGSFLQHNFGDEGQDKGVHVIDTDEGTTTFVPIKTRQFITVNGNDVPENIEEIVENNFVRFVGDTKEVRVLENLQEQGVELPNVRIELQRDYTQEARMDLEATMSESEIVKKYTEEKYPRVTQKALECLSEVV